jgi:hypothetical protein
MEREVAKGPLPLAGKLRLRLEGGRGHELRTAELTLALTTPHRRERAAIKMQALVRGAMARSWVLPILVHHHFMKLKVINIQCRWRMALAKMQLRRLKDEKIEWAVTTMQRIYRGFADRNYVMLLRVEKARFEALMRNTTILQSYFRMFLATWYVRILRHDRKVKKATIWLRYWKTMEAQRLLQRRLMLRQPVVPTFQLIAAERGPYATFGMDNFTPWKMCLHVAPLLENGDLDPDCDPLDAFTHDAAYYRAPADEAATQLQRHVRGIASRKRVAHLRDVAKTILTGIMGRVYDQRDFMINHINAISDVSVERSMLRQAVAAHSIKHIISETVERSVQRQIVAKYSVDHIISETVERSWNRSKVARHCLDFILDRTIQAHHYRNHKVVKLQAGWRGRSTRMKGHFHRKRVEMMQKALPKIMQWQAMIRRNKAQVMLRSNIDAWRREMAVIRIQKHGRAMLAKTAVDELRGMRTWLLRMWFDYAPIGTTSVQCSIRVVENERFDPYQYFLENPGEELAGNLDDMVEAVDHCVTEYLTSVGEDLLADEVLPAPVEIMPDFQHLSIRHAMETLQSIDFEAVHAETAVALEAAAKSSLIAEGRDPEEVEAEMAALALMEEEADPMTPLPPVPRDGLATPSVFSEFGSEHAAEEKAHEIVGGTVDTALKEPITPVTPAAFQESALAGSAAVPPGVAPGYGYPSMMPMRDMGPLVPGLEFEDQPEPQFKLVLEDAPPQTPPSLVGSPKADKRAQISFPREVPKMPEMKLLDLGVASTEPVLVESHPYPQTQEARARIGNELGAFQVARGLAPRPQTLPDHMADQYTQFEVGMRDIVAPIPASVPESVASRPPSAEPIIPRMSKESVISVEETPEERLARQELYKPFFVSVATDVIMQVLRQWDERQNVMETHAGTYTYRATTDIIAPVPKDQTLEDLPAEEWLEEQREAVVPYDAVRTDIPPPEVQAFRTWVERKFASLAEGFASLDTRGAGVLSAGEFRDGLTSHAWQYCDGKQATKLFMMHTLSMDATMTRLDFGVSDDAWKDYLNVMESRRKREQQAKAQVEAKGGLGLPGKAPEQKIPRDEEPLVPEAAPAAAYEVLTDAKKKSLRKSRTERPQGNQAEAVEDLYEEMGDGEEEEEEEVVEEQPAAPAPEPVSAGPAPAAPKVEPAPEPKAAPKAEAAPAPKAEPKPAPAPAPKAEPKPAPKAALAVPAPAKVIIEEDDDFADGQSEAPPEEPAVVEEEEPEDIGNVEATWDDPEAEKRAEEQGVLKAIDSSVVLVVRSDEELNDEVKSEVDELLAPMEDYKQFEVPRPPSTHSHRSSIPDDPLESLTPPPHMQVTPRGSPAPVKAVTNKIEKTPEGVVLPEIQAEAPRNVTGKDPLKKEKPKPPPLHATTERDRSKVAELTRKLLRAPGGFQANMSRLTVAERQMVLDEMKVEREKKLGVIADKEAKRQAAKKAIDDAEKDARKNQAKEQEEMKELDAELAEAQRSEMAVWRRKKAAEAKQQQKKQDEMLAKAKAEAESKVQKVAEQERKFKEDKLKRLKAHKKRMEQSALASAKRGDGVESLPSLTRHVHHHVHSHHGADDLSVTQRMPSVDEGAETQRYWAERVQQYGSEGLYPSENTGQFLSEMQSGGLYPSERSQYRSMEESIETVRLSTEKQIAMAKSASLPRMGPVLPAPSEMRKAPSMAAKLDKYSSSVSKATATYGNAGRVKGAIR